MLQKVFSTLLFVLILAGCSSRPLVNKDIDPPQLQQYECPTPIRLALVLGGGGVRGMAHVGVLYEFEQAGIPIDAIVGCSAGSIVGAIYADCPNAQRTKRVLCPLQKWDLLDLSLLNCRYGLVQGRYIRGFLARNLRSRCFNELQIPLYVVSTDIVAGKLVTFSCGPIIPAVHASAAVPVLFRPVVHCERMLVDGGVVDPIPVQTAKAIGAKIVVAVDLSDLLPKTCPTNLFSIGARSAEIKLLLQSESCADGADFLIRPNLGDLGMFDDCNNEAVFEAGRQAAREVIPGILEALKG